MKWRLLHDYKGSKLLSLPFFFCRKLHEGTERLEDRSWLQTEAQPHNLHSRSARATRKGVWSAAIHRGHAKVLSRRWSRPQWNAGKSLVSEQKNQVEKTESWIFTQLCRKKQIWDRWRREKTVGPGRHLFEDEWAITVRQENKLNKYVQ